MRDYVEKLLIAINEFDPNDKASVERLRDLVCIISDNAELQKNPIIRPLLYTASQKMRVFGYNKLNGIKTGSDTTNGSLDFLRNAAVEDAYRSQLNPDNILDIGTFEFGPDLWRVCYAIYAIVMVALFGISFFVKDKK